MHKSVLLNEVLQYLAPQSGETFLDATINGGGHSEAICRVLGATGTLLGIDEDSEALQAAKKRLASYSVRKIFFEGNFRNLDVALDSSGIRNADKVLFDLGLSSRQLEISGRGFSFQKDEPLLMTFSSNPSGAFSAESVVNEWDEENIAAILEGYGEEKHAKRIAKAIAETRREKKIETSRELAEIVSAAVLAIYRRGKTHPATKTFQAIRMAVNDELRALSEGLEKAWAKLSASGRIGVISFHSGEDRIVKNFFREKALFGEGKILTKKPVFPSKEEIENNPRSRSARLRVIQKI